MNLPPKGTPLFQRATGITPAERYLKKLCERSFLSLWSYPSVYRDQGVTSMRRIGKEVCDMLVVFEQHIIIFSDKYCEFPQSEDIDLNWARWFRRAVLASADQLFGGERWIRKNPERLYLDAACEQRFPLELPNMQHAKFHRIVVAHGVAQACQEHFGGGSGSLMIQSNLIGEAHYTKTHPDYSIFTVGQIDPKKGYVHVFDEISLDIVLKTLDTISDFVKYLEKKEQFMSMPSRSIVAAGEEELLAYYLTHLNKKQEHDFTFSRKYNVIYIDEGHWNEFCQSPERLSQIEADKSTYAWDALIEQFIHHAVHQTRHKFETITQSNLQETELMLRFMARENRTRRRLLTDRLLSLIAKTPADFKAISVVLPSQPGDPYYVFLLLPWLPSVPEADYREVRIQHLNDCCLVTKLKFPEALDIIGIATESGQSKSRSEDACYYDARQWKEEDKDEVSRLQQELEILLEPKLTYGTYRDYPSEETKHALKGKQRSKFIMKGRDRNGPCFCGSGKKFKKCCGPKLKP